MHLHPFQSRRCAPSALCCQHAIFCGEGFSGLKNTKIEATGRRSVLVFSPSGYGPFGPEIEEAPGETSLHWLALVLGVPASNAGESAAQWTGQTNLITSCPLTNGSKDRALADSPLVRARPVPADDGAYLVQLLAGLVCAALPHRRPRHPDRVDDLLQRGAGGLGVGRRAARRTAGSAAVEERASIWWLESSPRKGHTPQKSSTITTPAAQPATRRSDREGGEFSRALTTCPLSTRGGTRLVRLVRGEGRGVST